MGTCLPGVAGLAWGWKSSLGVSVEALWALQMCPVFLLMFPEGLIPVDSQTCQLRQESDRNFVEVETSCVKGVIHKKRFLKMAKMIWVSHFLGIQLGPS